MISFFKRLPLFRYLNVVANNVDSNRIKEIGANAACSEWLLRNGSTFKCGHSDIVFEDYNKLPSIKQFKITEIYSIDSSLMNHGFEHLKDLDSLRKFYIANNIFITNTALQKLNYVKNSLNELHIIDCPFITDDGVSLLTDLRKLKYLELSKLVSVQNKDLCIKKLKTGLPECKVDWND